MAGEAPEGVAALRVLVAVVRFALTLVLIAEGAIASPPAPRTESTVLREASRSDPAVLWGLGMLQRSGLLATSAETLRAPLIKRAGFVPGRGPDWRCCLKGTHEWFKGSMFNAQILSHGVACEIVS